MEQQPFIFSALLFTVSFLTPFCSCSDIKVKVIKTKYRMSIADNKALALPLQGKFTG